MAFLFLAFSLAACSEETAAVQPAAASDPICAAQAQSRADDAAVIGYDVGLQRKIRAYAYKDCQIWAGRSSIAGFR